MFQARVYKLQTEKLISAMSWPKISVSGLEQVAILVPVPVLAVHNFKKIYIYIFLVENHKIDIFQMVTKKSFHEPNFHLLSYLKMSHHPNFCSSLVHNYSMKGLSKGGHVVLSVKFFSFRKYQSTLFWTSN